MEGGCASDFTKEIRSSLQPPAIQPSLALVISKAKGVLPLPAFPPFLSALPVHLGRCAWAGDVLLSVFPLTLYTLGQMCHGGSF